MNVRFLDNIVHALIFQFILFIPSFQVTPKQGIYPNEQSESYQGQQKTAGASVHSSSRIRHDHFGKPSPSTVVPLQSESGQFCPVFHLNAIGSFDQIPAQPVFNLGTYVASIIAELPQNRLSSSLCGFIKTNWEEMLCLCGKNQHWYVRLL